MYITRNVALLGLIAGLITPALAKVSLDLSAPAKAKLGQTVTVSVKTDPSAKCKIEAQDAGLTQSLKLLDQTADRNGKASWKFDIPKSYKANEMPITVTVDNNGEQDKAVSTIKIKE